MNSASGVRHRAVNAASAERRVHSGEIWHVRRLYCQKCWDACACQETRGGLIRVNRSLDSTGKTFRCGLLEFLTTLLRCICEVRSWCWTRRPGSQTTPVIGWYTCGHDRDWSPDLKCSDRCPNTFGGIAYFPLKSHLWHQRHGLK